MEEWQKAMIIQAERQKVTNGYLRKINGALAELATKEDVNCAVREAVTKSTSIKDKLLWVMTLALIVLAGAAAATEFTA